MILLYRDALPEPVAVLQCDVPGCKEYLYWPSSWSPNAPSMRRFALMCGWTQPMPGKDMCQDHSLEVEERVKDVSTEPS